MTHASFELHENNNHLFLEREKVADARPMQTIRMNVEIRKSVGPVVMDNFIVGKESA